MSKWNKLETCSMHKCEQNFSKLDLAVGADHAQRFRSCQTAIQKLKMLLTVSVQNLSEIIINLAKISFKRGLKNLTQPLIIDVDLV